MEVSSSDQILDMNNMCIPRSTARINGVVPALLALLTSAPSLINNFTISMCPVQR